MFLMMSALFYGVILEKITILLTNLGLGVKVRKSLSITTGSFWF